MNDDPCVICGTSGHDAYDGACPKLNVPTAMDSPLARIYGPGKANAARQTIVKFRKSKKPRYQDPAAEATTDANAEALAQMQLDDQTQNTTEGPAKAATIDAAKDTVKDKVTDEDAMLNGILRSVGCSTEGLTAVRDITQTDPVETCAPKFVHVPDKDPVGPGNAFQPELALSKANKAEFPLRKAFAQASSDVLTNHFEVRFKPNTRFFVYEILKIPGGKSKRKAKYIFKTAEEAWSVLRDNKQYYATDHFKTIVSWKNLHETIGYQPVIPGDDGTQAGAIWQPEAIADGSERVQLFLKLHRELDLDGLYRYMDASHKESDPEFNFNPIISALNLAIAKSMTSDVFQQSSNKFFVKGGYEALLGKRSLKSLCAIRGYYFTIKPGMQKIFLNVNPATSAFFRPITVGEFLADETFSEDERVRLLKTLRVYIEYDRLPNKDNQEQTDRLNKPQNRVKCVFELGRKFSDPSMKFLDSTDPKKHTRVEKHLRNVFGKDFNNDLAAINVGNEREPVYYPREYLRILPYQIYKKLLPEELIDSMLKLAAHVPYTSRRLIEIEGMNSLGLNPRNGEQPLIPSAQLRALTISYGSGTPDARPNDKAQWNLGKLKNFFDSPGYSTKKRINYLLLVEASLRHDKDTVITYQNTFNHLLNRYNICDGANCLSSALIQGLRGVPYDSIKATIQESIQSMKKGHPRTDFVIMLLKNKSIPIYSAFKDVVDRYEALQSLCMTQAPNVKRGTFNKDITQYMANIMMKANLKFGGSNHIVHFDNTGIKVSLQDTLVLGADVTHPGSGSLVGCPSIAAVVGSIDFNAAKFRGSMRLQRTCKKEIIDDLEPMVSERLMAYFRATKSLPKNILYYRDGVSTGQFAQVRDEELPQIRSACKAKGIANIKITVVVAVKRHSTRFFPTSVASANGNCRPGTLVDRAITLPHYSDFYLQSHHGLKGTAIPTHYMVIANEIGIKDTELQELTYKLCYTYARATLGVSYPPPAYYADRLCDRGRAYLRNWFSPDRGSAEYKSYANLVSTIKHKEQGRLARRKVNLVPQVLQPGKGAQRKSPDEIAVEREHEKFVECEIEKAVLNRAVLEWNRARSGGPGPWAKELDDTMFWM
ncbi:hypothetical protein COCC4DRAFT_127590 [Bipolaris maydis ATCC 48331]|uniref:Piwi domain-containing protein n=2 Tax=Cochliobolus heterostrophus TaxID=5016 RepID=M2URL9_COCH5|nr:uncharacterized protein COCC4DRAFT_127590 [Bipolaris maydis ATCC 48331]EMD90548.1 hypothetical protein COCHEDRAFT_1105283 [Bipolaris maydis C5]KAJ5023634.1 Piwi domain-containing protein [Bipolaris maydis]ENI09240.1 hypothetical protein COCC4DRAFT_127590 [Bipolaris maydis ATCC 48331]KAJ5058422.1 Piwi domain-containing protein [Bipolaris maydis]KAJ6195664.1 Piwi domain-containing protein [Bipolaris maydis]